MFVIVSAGDCFGWCLLCICIVVFVLVMLVVIAGLSCLLVGVGHIGLIVCGVWVLFRRCCLWFG